MLWYSCGSFFWHGCPVYIYPFGINMAVFNLTNLALTLFVLYVLNSMYILYHFFHIPDCTGGPKKCLSPHATIDGRLEVFKSQEQV